MAGPNSSFIFASSVGSGVLVAVAVAVGGIVVGASIVGFIKIVVVVLAVAVGVGLL